MIRTYTLVEIDDVPQTHKGDIYTLYFYNKLKQNVYKIDTDGSRCGVSVRDKHNLSKDYKVGYSELPKYITSKLNK